MPSLARRSAVALTAHGPGGAQKELHQPAEALQPELAQLAQRLVRGGPQRSQETGDQPARQQPGQQVSQRGHTALSVWQPIAAT